MANELLSKTALIKIGGTAVARLTGWSLEVNKEPVDITNFDSTGAWKEFLIGLKEWSISFDGIVVRNAGVSNDYEDLLTSFLGSDATVAVLIDDSSASTDISGNAFLISLPVQGSLGDKQTYSGQLQGTGALSIV